MQRAESWLRRQHPFYWKGCNNPVGGEAKDRRQLPKLLNRFSAFTAARFAFNIPVRRRSIGEQD
jgi:hypothetical protein